MPGCYYRPIGRRAFFAQSLKVLAGGVLSYEFGGRLRAAQGAGTLHLALLSDTHVAADPKTEFRKFFPTENLKRVVAEVLETQPEAVLLNGDAARATGEAEDYQAVKGLLAPLAERWPVYIGLGNHDNRDNFLATFSSPATITQKVPQKHVLVIQQPGLRIILLDSLLYPNKVAGLLGKTQRDWLDKYLAGVDSRPTVLFVHHTLGDGDGELLDAPALYRIVQPYAKVKAIFYGHSHEYNYREHQGIHLINLPAVGYNFGDKEPVGWVDAQFEPEGVNLTLKAFGGNRQQDRQTVSLHWRSA